MSALSAASVRHQLRHPAQLVLALAGLALGVAAITAVDVATASASRAFDLSMAAVSGPATDEIVGGPNGIDERLYVRLATRFASLDFLPSVVGYVTVGHETLELVGADPLAEASLSRRSSAADGSLEDRLGAPGGLGELDRWLTEPGASVLAAATAQRLGIAKNGRFQVSVDGKPHEAVLIGVASGAQAGGETLLLTDIAQAQQWLGLVGRLSRIEVVAPPGGAGSRDIARLRAELPADLVLQGVEQHSRTSLAMTHAFTTSLKAMSLLALLVGLFLIYSAMSFSVVQRRKSFAVLRALGATRLELLGLVLAEAAVLGAVGALIGLAAGVALAHALVALVSRTLNDLYFVVTVNSLSIAPVSALETVSAGILTALLAAALPAWEAGQSAQLGLRRSVLESRAARAARSLAGLSAVLALAAVVILMVSQRSLAAGFIALLLVLLSAAAATPALLRASARFMARSVSGTSPICRVAFADVAASLSRTGVAVAALSLAIAAMIAVSMMVESFRLSLGHWLAETLRADIYVAAPGPGINRPERRLDPQVVSALASVAGVTHYSASRRVEAMSAHGPIALEAVSPAPETYAGIEVTRSLRAVWPAFRHGAILVAQPLAYRLRLAPGARLVLDTAAGPRSFEVAGIYLDYASDGGVLMDRAVYRRNWGDDAVDSLGLYLARGADTDKVVAALYSAAAGRQALLIGSNAAVRAQSMRIFDRTFAITRVLEWLAAAVAALGLLGSLTAWELERSRDLSVLRTLGLEPRGAAALILAQTAFMGLAALAAAVPAGLLAAGLLVTVINRRAFGWQIEFHLRGGALLEALWLTLAAALAAGLYPAWRSARAGTAGELREE
jgi:putative ABC transport system permease protein